ncbi:hypothetical protein AS189_13240 [Arthrobacter alpinus]|uniref:Histidine kinase/HSP90-like ATPase domain-containing protein n=1 Tax=Arthrobacter alpinus TaxID=656366 RepID=A0A0S2M0D7_9MICC|nr:histidine kinase [Arthrobacter alpinus]ALO67289.1 hypothetical protein AS189_13240 [Arthrobacter alpinus]
MFTLDDEELAIALAVAAGFAIENAKLFDDAQLRSRWLEAGRTIAVRMMGPKSDDEEDNRNWVAQTALKASESAVALIVGQPNEAGQVEVLAAAGTDASTWVRQLLDLNGEGISGVLKSGRPLAYEEASLLLGPATRGLSGPALLARLGTHAAGQGMIVLIRANGEPVFSALATDMVAVYCTQSALALELAKTHRIREQLVLFADRDRIAQDLHDVVIQRLFAAGLNIQGLARFVDESAGLARIRAITDELDTTIKELRDTIYSLRASATDADLLSSRILNTISKISRSLPYAPRIILSGPIDSKVTVELGEQVLAVVTEGVSNAVRHAQADEIDVAVSVDGQSVNVSVSDDGCGVGVLQGTSGLANMEVRALTFNGTFQLDSNGARGTRFLWSVPMDGKQPADGQDGKLAPMPANATVDPTSG